MRQIHTERRWVELGPTLVTANGQENGILTVEDTGNYKVKMKVTLQSDSFQQRRYEIKQILSRTEMRLGEVGTNHNSRADLTDWILADNPILKSPEQDRPDIPPADYERASYSEEPAMAKRILPVNRYGQENSPDNPLYTQLTDGEINIGTVNAELEVQLSHKDDFPDAGDVRDAVNVVDSFLIRRFEKINNVEYEGLADQGSLPSQAKWRITRKIKQPNGDLVTSIVGDTSYDQIWDNRASLFPVVTPTEFFDRKWEKVLPILNNANFLKLGNFDSMIPSFALDTATLDYFENGANIGRIKVRYVHELDWDMTLEAFINDSNGDILLDDDGTSLILE